MSTINCCGKKVPSLTFGKVLSTPLGVIDLLQKQSGRCRLMPA